jgi:hypothetical protein
MKNQHIPCTYIIVKYWMISLQNHEKSRMFAITTFTKCLLVSSISQEKEETYSPWQGGINTLFHWWLCKEYQWKYTKKILLQITNELTKDVGNNTNTKKKNPQNFILWLIPYIQILAWQKINYLQKSTKTHKHNKSLKY